MRSGALEIFKNKKVVIIGSTPPAGFPIDDFDVVVRCNDWWATDEGRCDVLFHIGTSTKLKCGYMLGHHKMIPQLKDLFLYRDGAEAAKMAKICHFHKIEVHAYDKLSEHLKPLRHWFGLYGTSPSTGLIATYTVCLHEPELLVVTGADLYMNEMDHTGWARHNPIGHCKWYRKLGSQYDFLRIGQDLATGIEHWEAEAKAKGVEL